MDLMLPIEELEGPRPLGALRQLKDREAARDLDLPGGLEACPSQSMRQAPFQTLHQQSSSESKTKSRAQKMMKATRPPTTPATAGEQVFRAGLGAYLLVCMA